MSGFLLGHIIDPTSGDRTGDDAAYDPSDLTTHGVIVGMTGSGKTGLGVILLEEALSKGLPTLIIDPKGEMGSLMLNFPDFDAADFLPWVDPGEAQQDGLSPEQHAILVERFPTVFRRKWKPASGWEDARPAADPAGP